MIILNYLILFVLFFIVTYILYYFFVTNGQIKTIRGKAKKKKEMSAELIFLSKYYNVNLDKIGKIRVLKMVNFINALLISALVLSVSWIDKIWLKLLVIVVILIPAIWATYYFLSKYLKHLERKIDNV